MSLVIRASEPPPPPAGPDRVKTAIFFTKIHVHFDIYLVSGPEYLHCCLNITILLIPDKIKVGVTS